MCTLDGLDAVGTRRPRLAARAIHNATWYQTGTEEGTHDGRKFRTLMWVDAFTHECLSVRVARKLKATEVIVVRPVHLARVKVAMASEYPWQSGWTLAQARLRYAAA